jgi:hypothetical protein
LWGEAGTVRKKGCRKSFRQAGLQASAGKEAGTQGRRFHTGRHAEIQAGSESGLQEFNHDGRQYDEHKSMQIRRQGSSKAHLNAGKKLRN